MSLKSKSLAVLLAALAMSQAGAPIDRGGPTFAGLPGGRGTKAFQRQARKKRNRRAARRKAR